jgi:hypothetical protein
MAIDTDYLTDKTCQVIMAKAERFDHNLTLQFGLLSYQCDDEADFIEKSKQLIRQMLKYNLADMDDMRFGEPPTIFFHIVLNKIVENSLKL